MTIIRTRIRESNVMNKAQSYPVQSNSSNATKPEKKSIFSNCFRPPAFCPPDTRTDTDIAEKCIEQDRQNREKRKVQTMGRWKRERERGREREQRQRQTGKEMGNDGIIQRAEQGETMRQGNVDGVMDS
jgi:hypothetical protein